MESTHSAQRHQAWNKGKLVGQAGRKLSIDGVCAPQAAGRIARNVLTRIFRAKTIRRRRSRSGDRGKSTRFRRASSR